MEFHKKYILLLLFFHFIREYYTYKKIKERVILCSILHWYKYTQRTKSLFFALFHICPHKKWISTKVMPPPSTNNSEHHNGGKSSTTGDSSGDRQTKEKQRTDDANDEQTGRKNMNSSFFFIFFSNWVKIYEQFINFLIGIWNCSSF